jgi:CheY-like chemotaxis protein
MSDVPVGSTDSASDAERQRVLVADDNADLRQLWRAYLTLSGFDVSEAANGAAAVAKAVADAPAVILMDFSMPGMDGAAAARALRADPRTANIPVVGLTAHGTAADRHNFHEVCVSVLEKPLRPEAVLEALRLAVQKGKPL